MCPLVVTEENYKICATVTMIHCPIHKFCSHNNADSVPFACLLPAGKRYLLVPVGESHHDVQRGQTEVEVEKGVAISNSFLFIVYSPARAILCHHTLST